ncbi:MAG: CRISPR-associated endonuclease Cas2 [Acidimicrobiales bacterium]
MADRTRFLVAYDIRDDGRLRQVAKCVEGYGNRLQYSVFLCDLSAVEMLRLRTELRDVIDHRVDSIAFVELGSPDSRGRHCFDFMGMRPQLPRTGGPTIV